MRRPLAILVLEGEAHVLGRIRLTDFDGRARPFRWSQCSGNLAAKNRPMLKPAAGRGILPDLNDDSRFISVSLFQQNA